MNENAPASEDRRIVCPATRDGAVRWFIIAAKAVAFAIWCYTDRKKYKKPEQWDAKHINEAAGYVMNHYSPYVLIPAGVVFLALGLRSLRRKLVADTEGIGYVGREKVPWSAVTALDASQLQEKQILHLRHGQGQTLRLDGYRLRNFRELVEFVEERAPRDQTGQSRKEDS